MSPKRRADKFSITAADKSIVCVSVWVAIPVSRSIWPRKMVWGNHNWCICFYNCNIIFGADTDALKRKNYLALQANFFIVILAEFNKFTTCFCQIAVTTYVTSYCGYFYYLIKFVSIVPHCDASQQPFTRPKIPHVFQSSLPVFWRRSMEILLLLFKKSKIGNPMDLLTLFAAI